MDPNPSSPRMPEPEVQSCDQLLAVELPEIINRRRNVEPPLLGPADPAQKDAEAKQVRASLIGLALSGGGLRSACFNLGVIQAFFRSGLLRHVDYLATVSGGGYIGSFLSSCLLAEGVKMRRSGDRLEQELPAKEAKHYPERIGEFLLNGKYLFSPTVLASHYLARLVLWNLILFSAILFLCTLAAFVWRWLDWPIIQDGLLVYSDNWVRELTRPFLPAVILFALWFVSWLGSALLRGRRSRARVSAVLLILAALALLIGFAVWLATPNISLAPPGSPTVAKGVDAFNLTGPQQYILYGIAAVISAALLPFLQPRQLIQAMAMPGKPYWMRWLINAASLALLLGIPFLLVCFLAKHDLCFWQPSTARLPLLHHSDIDCRRWEPFWSEVQEEKEKDAEAPSRFIWDAVTTGPDGTRDAEVEKLLTHPKLLKDKAPVKCATMTDDERERLHRSLTSSTRPLEERAWALKKRIIARLNQRVIGGPQHQEALPPLLVWAFSFMLPAEEARPDRGTREAEPGLSTHETFEEAITCYLGCTESPGKHTQAAFKSLIGQTAASRSESPILALLRNMEAEDLTPEQQAERHRQFLEARFPKDIQRRETVRRPVVIEQDQVIRLTILLTTGVSFFVFALIIPLNFTSMHNFYRERLAGAFIEPTGHGGTRQIPLANLDTTARGGPYHLLLATLNWFPTARTLWSGPQQRPTDSTEGFLFSRRLCGSKGSRYLATESYKSRHLTLDEAMTLSGAAFNPTQVSNPLLFWLMVVLNLRLGQWLTSPNWNRSGYGSAWGRLADLVRKDGEVHKRFITDGGHHDNLGLWPLLQRCCKLIILSDASADPKFTFAELARVIRRARVESEVVIENCEGGESLSLELIKPRAAAKPNPSPTDPLTFLPQVSRCHYLVFRLVYSNATTGHLIYLRATLTGDEPADVQCHALANDTFPHDPIGNQLFEPDQVESYRRLGEHIGQQLSRELTGTRTPDSLWEGAFPWPALDELCRRSQPCLNPDPSNPVNNP